MIAAGLTIGKMPIDQLLQHAPSQYVSIQFNDDSDTARCLECHERAFERGLSFELGLSFESGNDAPGCLRDRDDQRRDALDDAGE